MASGLGDWARRVPPFLLVLILITTLGPLQFGLHLAELNAPQDAMTCPPPERPKTLMGAVGSWVGTRTTEQRTGADCIPMTDVSFATVSSIFTVGGFAGALGAGPLTSSRGRLMAMRLAAVFFLLGSLVETAASSVPVLALGRLLSGVGAGASTVIVPLYISEVAPPSERGFFGTFTQISINVGILTTQTLGYFLSYGSAWRWVLGAGIAVSVAHAAGLLLVPESPVWLASTRSDPVLARRILQRIRGRNASIDDEVSAWTWGPSGGAAGLGRDPATATSHSAPAADDSEAATDPENHRRGGTHEGQRLLASPRITASNGPGGTWAAQPSPRRVEDRPHAGFLQVASDPLYRPALVAVVGIMFAQQFCGVNSIIMYSVKLLKDLLPMSSALLTIVISAVNLAVTIAASPLPDKLGRKTCLLVSILGQGSSSLVLALSIVFGMKMLSAISVLFFVSFFAIGLGPVPFILASELVGPEAVGALQSWALGSNYVFTFLIAQLFPIINKALNTALGGAGWVYFIFAVVGLAGSFFVAWNVPETKGKRDADEVWGRARRLD